MKLQLPSRGLEEVERVARSVLIEAGALLRARLGTPLSVSGKSAFDFVTDADRESEALIVDSIRRSFPDHRVVSEEGLGIESDPDAEVTWVVDPLDGTTNFIHGYPFFSVSIAVRVHKETLLGFVLDPVRGELFSARKGKGVRLNDQPVARRWSSTLGEALVLTGFPFRAKGLLKPYLQCFAQILLEVSDMRRSGSAALDLAYVACGRADGFWEAGLRSWDIAAGALMVTEAGGLVSDFWGANHYLRNGHVVAGSPLVHPFLLAQVGAHLAQAVGPPGGMSPPGDSMDGPMGC
jgi:myo-inositol-1(or 4)-monophosphatase